LLHYNNQAAAAVDTEGHEIDSLKAQFFFFFNFEN
jgi:hypothetical protein